MADSQGLGFPNGQEGRLIGKLQLMLTVLDDERRNNRNRPLRYVSALIETYKWCFQGKCDDTQGMFEVEPHSFKSGFRSTQTRSESNICIVYYTKSCSFYP